MFARAEYELAPAEGNVPIDGISPNQVDELCTARWEAHLHQVLPLLLAVHDAARTLAQLTPPTTPPAVPRRRRPHRSPATQPGELADDADVVGITRQSAHERWS